METPKEIRTPNRINPEILSREGEVINTAPVPETASLGYLSNIWEPSKNKHQGESEFQSEKALPVDGSIGKYFKSTLLMTSDFFFGCIAMFGGFLISPLFKWDANYFSVSFIFLSLLVLGTSLIISGFITGLYEESSFINRTKIIIICAASSVLAVSLTALFISVVLFQPIGRWVFLIATLIAFGGLSLPRLNVFNQSLSNKFRVIIVGDMKEAFSIYHSLDNSSKNSLYQVVAICIPDIKNEPKSDSGSSAFEEMKMLMNGPDHGSSDLPILITISDLSNMCGKYGIDKIIVGSGNSNGAKNFPDIMGCASTGTRIMSWNAFNEENLRQVSVDGLSPDWFYSASFNVNNPILVIIKRVVDVIISSVGLFVSFPIMLVVALSVKLTSRGPVLYKQIRTGRFGKTFFIYKFRTMLMDAEEGEAKWACENDERCTPIGGVLRKSRLDELPQLWNIFKGDMSFVGPRPERPEFVSTLVKEIPYYDLRHIVLPGLTGFAQVNYGYGASTEDAKKKLQYDLYYIKNFSVLLDMQIFMRTFSAMLKGAR